MKEICSVVKESKGGNKATIFKRLLNYGHPRIKKISETKFEYKQGRVPEGDVPKWVVLVGKPIDDIDDIDMGTGAQHGFFGPTNKENAITATFEVEEYLTD